MNLLIGGGGPQGSVILEAPSGNLRTDYHKLRNEYNTARGCLRVARILERWRAQEDAELVRLRYAPDGDPSSAIDYLEQTAEEMGADPREWQATRKRERARVERDGAWGLIGEYRTGPSEPWKEGAACWGFLGDDGLDVGGYAADSMSSTMEELEKAQADACCACGRPKVDA